mmetsp:Transcript_66438/g.107803  ORF Transcript_66438/g.107803 Transcript_66438/m.107803 type:complete len:146 (-) Transcript_66438:1005-1442(-)
MCQECHTQHGRSKTKTEDNGHAVSCLSQANMLLSTSKRAQKRKVARELDSLSKRLCCFIVDLFDKTKPLPQLAATNAAASTNTVATTAGNVATAGAHAGQAQQLCIKASCRDHRQSRCCHQMCKNCCKGTQHLHPCNLGKHMQNP